MQQVVQASPSADGLGRRKVERESGMRTNSKSQSSSFSVAGLMHDIKVVGSESPSHDRLVYLATRLIGHQVEVQVKNGSVYSGIFHSTNTEKDFGVILKMARLTKDGSSRGQVSDSVSKAPPKTLIILSKELVQVIAKGVSLTEDDLVEGLQSERRQDIMIDSFISRSHYVELERELEPWMPDENDSQCPEYENIFDGTWNRKWDQFETNKALFGVKSTFDEELYTTKLEKGPQMRELEREALRIAREIEGEETRDLHLAEERGLHLHEDFNIDEETRYSSVFRGFDDSGYEEIEDIMLDLQNTETFGGSTNSVFSKSISDLARWESSDEALASTTSSLVNEEHYSQLDASRDLHCSGLSDQPRQVGWESRINVNQFREQHDGKIWSNELKSSLGVKTSVPDKVGLSPSATAYAPSSNVSSKGQEYMGSLGELSYSSGSDKTHGENKPFNARRHGKPTSSTPDCASTASALTAPGLSPISSLGSLSSEKSTLNPYVKEFKFNPNAKSFTPSQTLPRPPSPVSEGAYYFPTNVSAGPHMHSLPMGIGIGPPFTGPQPIVYDSQGAPIQAPQAFVHPNGPSYGQQMILGHPRQALYMPPSHPTETPYK